MIDTDEDVRLRMPEGWKHFLLSGGTPHSENEHQKEFQFACDFMKEMAEALEDLTYETDHIETKHAPQSFWDATKTAQELLHKFKEWK